MDNSRIFAITQSVIAVIVVVGGGIMLFSNVPSADAIVGVVGVVIGFYFREATGSAIASRAQSASTLGAIIH